MTDLAVLALGFGVMPLAAIFLYSFAPVVMRHREAAWGVLAGVVAFLGLSHAMAAVLLDHVLLGDRPLATFLAVLGLLIGIGVGWILLEGPFVATEPNRILFASVAFLGLHSFGDGLVLGGSFLGIATPTLPLDRLTVSATVVHRFIEGSLVVVPALMASWKSRGAFALLFASLVSVPATYLPAWLLQIYGVTTARTLIETGTATVVSAIEVTLALFLVARAFLPLASVARGTRWLLWTAAGFVGISLVHFLVE